MSEASGIALLCDLDGNIREILRDPLGLGAAIRLGMPFARLAASGNLAKALSFQNEIVTQGAAFDWEINIAGDEQVITLHFTGGRLGEAVLIVGAENGKFSLKLYEELMRISNEQTNTLRAALKDAQRGRGRDQALYEEISRLNNEMASMQRELAKQNAELERLNQEKNRFLGMAAHDLRNPLHVILGYSEFLLDACDDPEPQQFLNVIVSASRFMVSLVDDLLDVAKIESGQLHLEYAPVDLAALATQNVALNRTLAAQKQITIDLLLAPLPTALVDGAKIEQVLNNLIGNAVKFSQPGGRITVQLKNEGATFGLSVQDEGAGIPEAEQAQLFTAFQRGHKGTEGEKSTGLGLVIVKRIVEGHGGKIWLESCVGQGATFFVSIPFQPAAEG